MADFTIKRRDTGPAITDTLTGADGQPAILTGATVRFHMSPQFGAVAPINALATVVNAIITSPTQIHVKYQWAPADTANAGLYWAEWEVTFADTSIQTFPNSGSFTVEVVADLA